MIHGLRAMMIALLAAILIMAWLPATCFADVGQTAELGRASPETPISDFKLQIADLGSEMAENILIAEDTVSVPDGRTPCITLALAEEDGPASAPTEPSFALPDIQLSLAYMRALKTGENRTCFLAGATFATAKELRLAVDVLFAPDFEHFGGWGVGASANFAKAGQAAVKIGAGKLGGIPGWIAYLALSKAQ